MAQRRPVRRRRPKEKDIRDTPLRTRVIMALFSIFVLSVLFYFFHDMQFPTEITYKNVRGGNVPYGYQRETPNDFSSEF